jgi:hypothetical protein
MSVPDIPPHAPLGSRPERPQGLGGCLVAFLVVVGIVLVLPGLCSLIFLGVFGIQGLGAMLLVFLLTFVVGIGGIMLIRYAVKNR